MSSFVPIPLYAVAMSVHVGILLIHVFVHVDILCIHVLVLESMKKLNANVYIRSCIIQLRIYTLAFSFFMDSKTSTCMPVWLYVCSPNLQCK